MKKQLSMVKRSYGQAVRPGGKRPSGTRMVSYHWDLSEEARDIVDDAAIEKLLLDAFNARIVGEFYPKAYRGCVWFAGVPGGGLRGLRRRIMALLDVAGPTAHRWPKPPLKVPCVKISRRHRKALRYIVAVGGEVRIVGAIAGEPIYAFDVHPCSKKRGYVPDHVISGQNLLQLERRGLVQRGSGLWGRWPCTFALAAADR